MDGIPRLSRGAFLRGPAITRLGDGALGGKASGLVRAQRVVASLAERFAPEELEISIPRMTVLAADCFERFLELNGLDAVAGLRDERDDVIAMAFQRGRLPADLLGDLQSLATEARAPLAVRSSSLLEDALEQPFAGVYATKMIANNQPDAASRFRGLVEAIKLVFASTWFRDARQYIAATRRDPAEERMAVIVQEVVGRRHGERFYPDVSAVGRSFNFYPSGHAKPDDGVTELALGLGRTIVDDGVGWAYCPRYPRTAPPYTSLRALVKQGQTAFWAVNMGKPPAYDPTRETEFLVQADLAAAESDGTLAWTASTYVAADDRLVPGTSRPGPRLLDFAPLRQTRMLPFSDAVVAVLDAARAEFAIDVEIELAFTLDPEGASAARLGLLQVRPMMVSAERVEISAADLEPPGLLLAAHGVLGNGAASDVTDVVLVRREAFEAGDTPGIAQELDALNQELLAAGRPYLLVGFGRWGTSDPAGGVPVAFAQISGARAIVEAMLPGMAFRPSQGAHFFHNVTSFRVLYFSAADRSIDWSWLDAQPALRETPRVRWIRLPAPLTIRVDGRTGQGVIRR